MVTPNADEILRAAMALPRTNRERIARELWDSVPPPGVMSEDDPGFAEELDRRITAYHEGKVSTSTWEEVQARLSERLESSREPREG